MPVESAFIYDIKLLHLWYLNYNTIAMTNVNYALLAALVDEQEATLFDESFAHIIGYSISELAESKEGTCFYKTTDVREYVHEKVGVYVPIGVISSTLKAIARDGGDVQIQFCGDHDNDFSIKRAWTASKRTRVIQKTHDLQQKIDDLENLFDAYLEAQGVTSELRIADFLHSNTEEALAYITQGEGGHINEQYIHVARFFENIRQNDSEMYDVACDILWGAMIAGLLIRADQLKPETPGLKVEYFLDTPIVMGILDLSREFHVAQAKDLLRVIAATDGIAKVHPLTLQEVDSILGAVKKSGQPYRSNELAEAYFRRNLTPSDIVREKINLVKNLQKQGVAVVQLSRDQITKVVSDSDRSLMKQLAILRGTERKGEFREEHDICVWKYVARHTNQSFTCGSSRVYFVTSNVDLIKFTVKNGNSEEERNSLIRIDNVVMNLWLHGGFNLDMKKELLLEKISKCFVANDVDTTRRMDAVISRYKDIDPVTQEEAAALFDALADRPPLFLKQVDDVMQQDNDASGGASKAALIVAAKEMTKKKRELEEEEWTRKENALRENVRIEQERSEEKNIAVIEDLKNKLEVQRSLVETQKKLADCETKLALLEKDRDRSIKMWLYYLPFICLGLIVISMILFHLLAWVAIVGLLFTLCVDRSKLENLIEGPTEYRDRRGLSWEQKHPDYGSLKCELKNLQQSILNLESTSEASH